MNPTAPEAVKRPNLFRGIGKGVAKAASIAGIQVAETSPAQDSATAPSLDLNSAPGPIAVNTTPVNFDAPPSVTPESTGAKTPVVPDAVQSTFSRPQDAFDSTISKPSESVVSTTPTATISEVKTPFGDVAPAVEVMPLAPAPEVFAASQQPQVFETQQPEAALSNESKPEVNKKPINPIATAVFNANRSKYLTYKDGAVHVDRLLLQQDMEAWVKDPANINSLISNPVLASELEDAGIEIPSDTSHT